MADLLFHSGTAATDTGLVVADVLVRGEQIADIGPGLRATGAERFDAGGMYVLPGGIDVHTHLDLDTGAARASDDWRTGTIAAACGGTTAVVDHPGFGPGGCSLFHQIDRYHELAAGSAAVDYSFHGAIQHVDDAVIRDLGRLMDRGITTCKAYLTYDHRLSDQDLLAVLERVRRLGGLTAVHCENHGMIEHLRRRFHEEGKREPFLEPKGKGVAGRGSFIDTIFFDGEKYKLPGPDLYFKEDKKEGKSGREKEEAKDKKVPERLNFLSDAVYMGMNNPCPGTYNMKVFFNMATK